MFGHYPPLHARGEWWRQWLVENPREFGSGGLLVLDGAPEHDPLDIVFGQRAKR